MQYDSRVVMLDDGKFLIVWHQKEEGNFSIWGRLFEWDGSTISRGDVINISENASNLSGLSSELKEIAQYGITPKVVFRNQKILISWISGSYLFAQMYDDEMNLEGTLHMLGSSHSNALTPHHEISMNDSYHFIIAREVRDNSGNGIQVRKYDKDGNTIGIPFLANVYNLNDQGAPSITLANDGSSIVTWESYEQEGIGEGYGIYAQRYDASNNPIGDIIHVNSHTTDDQRTPSITAFDDGTFYISWSSYGQDGHEEGIYGQVFAADGSRIDEEFQVNVLIDPEQEKPRTANNGENLFITAWEDGGNDGSYKGIFAQRYEILSIEGGKKFYPIGTTTPSTLLGDELAFPNTYYAPTDNISTVRVAIIDTGIDADHPVLNNSLWQNNPANDGDNCILNDIIGYDFVNEDETPEDLDGHGTQVAGIVSRNFNRDIKLELMNLKFHERGRGTVFDAICAIYYAVDNGADVINLSWGFEASEKPVILEKAIQYASDNDILVVTTAGNTSKNLDNIAKYPSNLEIDNLIVVTSYQYESISKVRKLSNYASYGKSKVDIAAYGFVETATLGDTLTKVAGTSLAAPFVTRTAATLRGLYPMLTAAEIKECILITAQPDTNMTDKILTEGILDHDAAQACAHDKAMGCLGIDLAVSLDQTIDSTYKSDAFITSDANIDSAEIVFKATEYLEFLPNFQVEKGAIFRGEIEDCNPGNNQYISPSKEELTIKFKKSSEKRNKLIVQLYLDSPQVITLSISNDHNKEIDFWRTSVDKSGWFEKIIHLDGLPASEYSLTFDLNKRQFDKRIKVSNHIE